MSRHTKWIIEARDESGQLKFNCPQPESVFGLEAITGLTDWEMSRPIFQRIPNATLDGGSIALWPRLLNPNWTARKKTW